MSRKYMFTLAILIGTYSYLIFFLGIFGLLYREYIFWVSISYIIIALLLLRRKTFSLGLSRNGFKIHSKTFRKRLKTTSGRVFFILLVILFLQILINLVGALGPELAFDALWYHLTLPNLYILFHSVTYIPGGLFYYSAMPKLTEMIYLPALVFGGETAAKLIHFSFGLLTCLVLYKLSRKFFTPTRSLLAVLIFYANLVVDWESITGYIDLARAFFEVLSVYAFITFYTTQKRKWFVLCAIMIGFAIATKVLAIGSLIIFILLLTYYGFKRRATLRSILLHDMFFALIALLVPLPWFIYSLLTTGNPVYPFFTKTYAVSTSSALLNPGTFLQSFWNLFVHSPDPLSPVYIAFLPLTIVSFVWSARHPLSQREGTKDKGKRTILYLYAILSLLIWYVTPNTGGGRFIVPYLPVYSLLIVTMFDDKWPRWFTKSLFIIIGITALVSIGYRGIANRRYIPVIFGRETKREFLTNNLNFNFGDFYDTDTYFSTHILPTDTVLLYGFHNEYYIDFPFVDSSYIAKGQRFNYISVQHGTIPSRFAHWQVIYHNKKTGVELYSLKNKQWQSY